MLTQKSILLLLVNCLHGNKYFRIPQTIHDNMQKDTSNWSLVPRNHLFELLYIIPIPEHGCPKDIPFY